MSEGPTLQLAEVRWTYRRWYAYALTVVLAGLAGYVISRLDDAQALKVLGLALCGLIALVVLVYMAGAVTTDLARLAAAVKAGNSPGEQR